MGVLFIDAVSEQLPAADTTVYTCPAGVTAIVVYALATCEDATGTTVTTNIVQSGGAVAVTNIHGYDAAPIAAGTAERLTKIEGACLHAGDFLSCAAADASRLNMKFTLKEIRPQ
jgi:hypothetical protein